MTMPADPAARPAPAVDVVAIDGPSGSGKSSVARMLAERLGYAYLDTGAMYRAVTWFFLENELADVDDHQRVLELLSELRMDLLPDGKVLTNGRDISTHLRSREVESRVSAVSAIPVVREQMRQLQQQVAERNPVVAEGRDMCSVVFPHARFKFFLDAEPEERARRRALEFQGRGRTVAEQDVLEEIAVRDRLDSTRKDAPLSRTREAEYVDTTGLSLTQVVDSMMERIRSETSRENSRQASAGAAPGTSAKNGECGS